MRALIVIALSSSCLTAAAQAPTLTIRPDRDTAVVGDSITWTVSVTGGLLGDAPLPPGSNYVSSYNLSFLASDPTLAEAVPFASAFFPITTVEPGTPTGASIFNTYDVQSGILGSLTSFGALTLGSFTTTALANGSLTYDIADGTTHQTQYLRVRNTSAFTTLWEGRPGLLASTVTITPASGTPAALGLFGTLLARRRR